MPPPNRPSWQGQLRLSLVSCPVLLYPATQNARVSLNRLSKASHNRLRQQMYDEQTREVVEPEDRILGFEYSKGEYVLIDPEEREALLIESSKVLDIEEFVDLGDIDRLFWSDPYYMVPDGQFAQEAFAVIREAMAQKEMVALGRVAMAGRERLVAIEPYGKGMRVTRLRAANEVRDADQFFDRIKDVKLPAEMLATAEAIVNQKHGPFEPSMFVDRYQEALRKLVTAKTKGQKPVVPRYEEPKDTKVVNLFDELRRSLDESAPAGKAASKKPAAKQSVKHPARPAAKRKSA